MICLTLDDNRYSLDPIQVVACFDEKAHYRLTGLETDFLNSNFIALAKSLKNENGVSRPCWFSYHDFQKLLSELPRCDFCVYIHMDNDGIPHSSPSALVAREDFGFWTICTNIDQIADLFVFESFERVLRTEPLEAFSSLNGDLRFENGEAFPCTWPS